MDVPGMHAVEVLPGCRDTFFNPGSRGDRETFALVIRMKGGRRGCQSSMDAMKAAIAPASRPFGVKEPGPASPDRSSSRREIIRSDNLYRFMTGIPVNTVPVDDVVLAYRESGSGDPVVFINGLGSTMDMWNPPVLSRISERYRVIIFDNRGTGFSSSSDKPFSIPLFARDTAALMDALGISSAHVLGLSMGASVAQELALGFPGNVNKLILVAGECGGPESVRMQPEIMAQLMDKSGTVHDVASRMFSLLFPPSWLASHDPFSWCPEVYETTGEEIVARQASAFFGWTGSFFRLAEIHSPTLVITGTDDVIVPPVNSHIIRGRIPHAQLVEIPGAGHGLMYQVPDRFSDCVLTFLDRTIPYPPAEQ